MQADAYAGFIKLYEANRKGGPIVEAACWAHARRKFFDLARLSKAPIAAKAVKRIDLLFAIEPDRNRKAQRHRSTGLACGRARSLAGSPRETQSTNCCPGTGAHRTSPLKRLDRRALADGEGILSASRYTR
jgi:hypothetical protein